MVARPPGPPPARGRRGRHRLLDARRSAAALLRALDARHEHRAGVVAPAPFGRRTRRSAATGPWAATRRIRPGIRSRADAPKAPDLGKSRMRPSIRR